MKALLLLVALAGVGGYVYKTRVLDRPTLDAACAALNSVCGEEDGEGLCKDLGAAQTAKATSCVVDAETCVEARGCIMGAELEQLRRGVERSMQ